MKTFLLAITMALTTFGMQAQTAEAEVRTAVDRLMQGIGNADDNILNGIASDALVYGHSSGKVQDKKEFVAEIVSKQPLVYRNIRLGEQKIYLSGDVSIVRHVFEADTETPEGTKGHLRIGNVLVWQKQGGEWKLLARQAYKL
jgi:ketosteroid isomerase-like protein